METDFRCSVLVARDDELAILRGALDTAAESGRGSALLLTGEAGIGKSRLAREAASYAAFRGLPAHWGRASPAVSPDPFRAVVELVAGAVRRLGTRPCPELDPYRPALARLVPAAGPPPSAEPATVVLAEGVLRLIGAVGGLAVLEDLHWADADTLAVVEYVANNIADVPCVLVATLRAEESTPAVGLTRSLARTGSVTVLTLNRLDRPAMVAMAAACLRLADDGQLPSAVIELLERSADGLPLLVEDLLAAAERQGHLLDEGDGWRTTKELQPSVPLTFVDTVRERMTRLSGEGVSVLHAAAVFGRAFPWELLAAVTGLDDGVVLEALRTATAIGLVTAAGDGFSFRHALTAAAVLDDLFPPERALLSRRAVVAAESAHPGLDGAWRILVADLREAAGDRVEASQLLLGAGREALASGALTGALSLLERAVALAAGNGPSSTEAQLTLLEALVAAGESERADDLGRRLLVAAEGTGGASWVVTVHLFLARAHLASGPDRAGPHLARARAAAAGDRAAESRVDALAAQAALESPRPDRLEAAEALARHAVGGARAAGLHEVACEAMEVIGRCARVSDLDVAEAAFERQLEVAAENDLAIWRIRALYELGTIDLLRRVDPRRAQAAHDAAVKAGAVVLAAGYSINLIVSRLQIGAYDEAIALARSCEATVRRLGLTPLVSTTLVLRAVGNVCLGRRAEAEALLGRAGETAGGQEAGGDLAVFTWGVCRAMTALLNEDRLAAHAAFEHAAEAQRHAPALTTDPFSGLWLLVRLVEGSAGADDLALLDRLVPGSMFHRIQAGAATAVVLGRAGRGDEASAALAEATTATEAFPLHRHLHLRLVSEAALADGWGDAPAWLLQAELWFSAHDHRHVAAACRRMLRAAGVVVGRGGAAEAEVPVGLRRLGVTAREADVLDLVAGRLTNRQIADRLYLSPRTVEKHVASLLMKLGADSRDELGSRAHPNT